MEKLLIKVIFDFHMTLNEIKHLICICLNAIINDISFEFGFLLQICHIFLKYSAYLLEQLSSKMFKFYVYYIYGNYISRFKCKKL